LAFVAASVREEHLEARGPSYNVAVREDIPIRRDDNAGAGPSHIVRCLLGILAALPGLTQELYGYHGRANPIYDCDYRPGVGVQQFFRPSAIR